jgi:hypothetical protein
MRSSLLARTSETLACFALASGVLSGWCALLRFHRPSAGVHPAAGNPLEKDLRKALLSCADLEIALESGVLPGTSSDRRLLAGSSPNAQIDQLDERLSRAEEVVRLRCALITDGGGGLVDELFSSRHYTERIRDPRSTLAERVDAFLRMTNLLYGSPLTNELEPHWVRDALTAIDEADLASLLLFAGAGRLPATPAVQAIVLNYARYSPSPMVRRQALGCLELHGTREAWKTIDAALDDPAEEVRATARNILVHRETFDDD